MITTMQAVIMTFGVPVAATVAFLLVEALLRRRMP